MTQQDAGTVVQFRSDRLPTACPRAQVGPGTVQFGPIGTVGPIRTLFPFRNGPSPASPGLGTVPFATGPIPGASGPNRGHPSGSRARSRPVAALPALPA